MRSLKKNLIASLLTIPTIIWGVLPASASSLSEVLASTHILYQGNIASCSGQFIETGERDLFVTAEHCVRYRGAQEYNIRLITEDSEHKRITEVIVYLDVIKRSEGRDVAILQVRDEGRNFPVVEMRDVIPSVGQEVFAVGYPSNGMIDGSDLSIADGLFTGMVKSPDPQHTTDVLKSTAYVSPGSSGGGLYIKEGDEFYLVGVTSMWNPSLPGLVSYHTPISSTLFLYDTLR